MLRFIPRDAHAFDERAAAALRPYDGAMAQLLYARGITDAAQADVFLHPTLSQLHDPMKMSGMPEAVTILVRARKEKLPTVVYGDYDVDGVCACSLLSLALRRYGIEATPHVPLRKEGYGLNAAAITTLAKRYKLLITVDLGITNHEEVRLAQNLGMTVIVTDHHSLALENCPANAVVNPLLGDYPYRKLCGTGVAFKLAQVLLGIDNCMEYLDLAALATVADVVPLTGENRVLVALGLPVIAARKRLGLRELLRVSGEVETVDAETLGFRLGPRLNAAGRLDDADKGIRLMMTDNEPEARELAEELDRLNTARKTTESNLVKAAELTAQDHDFIAERVLIVKGKNWHVGVIGLACGRLCQRYDCPVCVLSEQDGMLHGSLRSVPGVNIHKCLQTCDDLLLRYGGHEQAAGVTLTAENYAAFCERLQLAVSKLDASCFVPSRTYDAEIELSDCTDALLNELSLLAPHGCENPSPLLLARGLVPEERRAVGNDAAHLKITFRQNRRVLSGIAFSMGAMAVTLPDLVDVIFSLGRNTFRGVTSLQMEIKAIAPVPSAERELIAKRELSQEQSALVNGLMEATRLSAEMTAVLPNNSQLVPINAGKSDINTERIQVKQSWAILQTALHECERGLLLVARTKESALQALALNGDPHDKRDANPLNIPADTLVCQQPNTPPPPLAIMDVATHIVSDLRGFHTLLISPVIGAAHGHWRQIWLLDGQLCDEESALWLSRCPQATVHVLTTSEAMQALLTSFDASDDAFRALYKSLRTNAFRNIRQIAQSTSLSDAQVRLGLEAFSQLGLITFVESPFAYTLRPPVKCQLNDSPILRAIRRNSTRKEGNA